VSEENSIIIVFKSIRKR